MVVPFDERGLTAPPFPRVGDGRTDYVARDENISAQGFSPFSGMGSYEDISSSEKNIRTWIERAIATEEKRNKVKKRKQRDIEQESTVRCCLCDGEPILRGKHTKKQTQRTTRILERQPFWQRRKLEGKNPIDWPSRASDRKDACL